MSVNPSTRFIEPLLPATTGADADTVLFQLTPSSTDVGPYSDSATEILALVPSATELTAHNYADAATELYKLTPYSVDIRISVDAGTELFYLTPTSDDHYCPQKVEFEGDLYSRWSAEKGSRWKASNQSRWEGDFLGVGEGLSC